MIRAQLRWLRTERGRIHARYAATSAVSVLVGQAILGLSFGVLRWPARVSNLLAFVVAGSVSYALNRRWTWGRSGRSHPLREVLPFWVLAVAGLVASTWAVGATEAAAPRITTVRAVQTLLVMAASLGAFGTLWVVKFVVFDRFLFGSRARA